MIVLASEIMEASNESYSPRSVIKIFNSNMPNADSIQYGEIEEDKEDKEEDIEFEEMKQDIVEVVEEDVQ